MNFCTVKFLLLLLFFVNETYMTVLYGHLRVVYYANDQILKVFIALAQRNVGQYKNVLAQGPLF